MKWADLSRYSVCVVCMFVCVCVCVRACVRGCVCSNFVVIDVPLDQMYQSIIATDGPALP